MGAGQHESDLDRLGLEYEEAEGEAAYGPKLDIQARNVHGKEDTIITVQIDFALPERFDSLTWTAMVLRRDHSSSTVLRLDVMNGL